MADIIKVDVTQPANKIAVNISDRGQKGDAGADGATGADGADGATGADGADGADGVGVPTGGTTGQVLSKSSAVDYATTWVDQASGNPFDQTLNTNDSPEFQGMTLTGDLAGEGITATSTVEIIGYGLDIYSVLGKGTNFEKLSMSVDALGDATISTSSGGTGDDGDLILEPASGGVGIGKTPDNGYALDVNGKAKCSTFRVTGGYFASTVLELKGALVRFSNYTTGSAISFTTGAAVTEHMRIDGATGNVGINTTSPSAKLDVNGDLMVSGQNDLHVYSDLDSPTSDFERLSLSVDALGDATIATSSGGLGDDGDLILAPAGGDVEIGTTASDEERWNLTIHGDMDGRVGTFQSESLTIGADVTPAQADFASCWLFKPSLAGREVKFGSTKNTSIGFRASDFASAWQEVVGSYGKSFAGYTNSALGAYPAKAAFFGADKQLIAADSKVGIGIESPSATLDVNGDARFRARIIRSKSVYVGTDTTDDVALHVCDSATAFVLTVTDGADDGEEIKVVNRGAGTVTLSGKINTTTAVTSLASGETIVLNWDATDDEWQ